MATNALNNDFLLNIQSIYPSLTKAEKKVADYTLQNSKAVRFLSITDLAEACHVSLTSVFRFCKVLKLQGYQEFKGEYLQAEQLKTQLLDMGYTFESAERLYLNFQEKNRRLNEVLAEVRRQQRIGKKIMQEQKERMQSRDKQKSRERGGESRDL